MWALVVAAGAFAGTLAALQMQAPAPTRAELSWPYATRAAAPEPHSAHFGFCHTGGGRNCVVDGDTFWFEGQKYRLADIDTPETHPPRCAQEARLGTQATERLRDWLNSGAFRLEENGRDSDRYGRKLRIATRDGVSVGSVLIDAGLARPWEGYRRPWC